MKFVSKLVLRFIVYSYIFSIASCTIFDPSFQKFKMTQFQDSFFLDGEVTSINTPTYGNAITKFYLEEFNELGNYGAVRFSEKGGGIFNRKIEIIEAPMLYENDVGETWPGLRSCTIHLANYLNYKEYRQVLFHEYLHCFGYNHVDNPHDLMYPSVSRISEDNIRDYAEDLSNRITKWKNSKN